ncbi:hypothetical protein CBZ_30200 [Cellulomonas biazotea]|uniref:Uncharacterized protein n=1 Tax=Cellulomonas biazotea TaxID=1709 RepID=A0A402DV13_9CELL|nr:hypothetical protein CBZ_30200 [Cellulomonas biazotea]
MSVVSRDAERFSEVGRGAFSRGAAAVYWAVVVEALIVLTSAPGIVALLLLDRSPGNAPLFALAALPFGPSLAAAVFAWRDWMTTPPGDRDLQPARHYWRGYRLNWRDVLRWWVPTLVVLAVLGVNVAGAGALGGAGGTFALVSLVLAVAVLAWAGHALVLSSLFAFRTRDVARLAAYYLAARPVSSLGVVALLVVAAGVAVLATDWLLVLLASPLVALLVRNAGPVIADATDRFTTS